MCLFAKGRKSPDGDTALSFWSLNFYSLSLLKPIIYCQVQQSISKEYILQKQAAHPVQKPKWLSLRLPPIGATRVISKMYWMWPGLRAFSCWQLQWTSLSAYGMSPWMTVCAFSGRRDAHNILYQDLTCDRTRIHIAMKFCCRYFRISYTVAEFQFQGLWIAFLERLIW